MKGVTMTTLEECKEELCRNCSLAPLFLGENSYLDYSYTLLAFFFL